MGLFQDWLPADFEERATEFCARAQRDYQLDLDYAPATLRQLDLLIDGEFGRASADSHPDLIVAMACYVGEVLVRHSSGQWLSGTKYGNSPAVVIQGKLQTCTYPFGRVWRRFEYGAGESLADYYREVMDTAAKF